MSMTEEAFNAAVTKIRNHLGCSKDLAAEYAMNLGEKPETQNGQILIRNGENRVIARLPASVMERE